MVSCANCGTTIVFGGKRSGEYRFCSENCLEQGHLLLLGERIPNDLVARTALEWHAGACPKCDGSGPVDVHTYYTIWSVILFTQYKSVPQISCRSCGVKKQFGSLISSLLFGWWGVPYGMIMTPVQVSKNFWGLVSPVDPLVPSPELKTAIRKALVLQALADAEAEREE